ncbi:hypothetical protein GALMADRAFT_216956 [Galerina marginata CBS 339.88]|uniref:Amine oxidase domain-containing protein n=1 Tax=Galerina marginata (strain CBS 339.88) TaxID=685588 RepID=A0A067SII8_GALM3|nr:hypothetical protein GALMADRAFT_216956 [Galerina marginata CBS 339.88]
MVHLSPRYEPTSPRAERLEFCARIGYWAAIAGAVVVDSDHGSKSSPDDSENFLLSEIYQDLAALHGQTPEWYERETLDHYAFDWYHNQYTMDAYIYPTPGQFSAFYPSIVRPAAGGRFHIGGEAASKKQTWVAGALHSAWREEFETRRVSKAMGYHGMRTWTRVNKYHCREQCREGRRVTQQKKGLVNQVIGCFRQFLTTKSDVPKLNEIIKQTLRESTLAASRPCPNLAKDAREL